MSFACIVAMLSQDIIKLVLIAIVIGSPIAWYATRLWLNDFAYRINIQFWMFAVAGMVAIALALITVSSQAIKAAWTNPARTLKSE